MHDFGLIKRFPPAVQVCIGFIVGIISIIIVHFAFPGNAYEFMGAFTGILFFALGNCILSLFHESFQRYTLPSFLFYVILLAGLLLAAKRFSGQSIWQHGEYQGMTFTLTLFYIVLSLLMRIIRGIYLFTTEH